MKATIYTVTERAFEYNDNYYTSQEGTSLTGHTYPTEALAKVQAVRLTRGQLKGLSVCEYMGEDGIEHFIDEVVLEQKLPGVALNLVAIMHAIFNTPKTADEWRLQIPADATNDQLDTFASLLTTPFFEVDKLEIHFDSAHDVQAWVGSFTK